MTQTSSDRQTAPETRHDAETVRDELNTALRSQGITLPSLWVEPVGYAECDDRRPLIQLGRCNLETARKLITALRNTADVQPEVPALQEKRTNSDGPPVQESTRADSF